MEFNSGFKGLNDQFLKKKSGTTVLTLDVYKIS